MIYGIIVSIKSMINKFKNKEFSYEFILLYILFVCFIGVNCIEVVNVNKMNCIWLPLIMFIVIGLNRFFEVYKKFKIDVIIFYTIYFACFCVCYIGMYNANSNVKESFKYGIKEAIEYASNYEDMQKIYVDDSIYYSQVLFYSQVPVNEYRSTVNYSNIDMPYVTVNSFANFYFGVDYDNLSKDYIYIIPNSKTKIFEDQGFKISVFGNYAVAVNDRE